MEVPVLYYNVDGSQIFRHDILQHIFQEIGSSPFVVLSVNGMKRTGKSFILTQLLRQLRPGDDEIRWKSEPELSPSVGIEIWSEPIRTFQNGQELCVVLLKTETSLEPPATIQQNATVSAISLLLSSFFILNVRKTISKENLSFLQYVLNLARSLGAGGGPVPPKFQRILFLVRDMELRVKDFSHGYHTPHSKPQATAHSQTNLFTQIFSLDPTRQPLEVQHTFRQVLSAFVEFGLFALPEPGSRTGQSTFRTRELDLEFHNYVQAVTDLLLNPDSPLLLLETKKAGGLELTGYEFMEVIDQLQRVLKRSPNSVGFESWDPPVEQSRAEMINTISTSNLVSLYVSTINDFIAENTRKTGNAGMYQKTLAEKMNSFLKICVETFSRRLSLGDDGLKEKFKEALSEEILEKMKLFETLNDSRLKYARQAHGLNSEANAILDRLEALRNQEKEADWEESRVEEEMDREIGKRLRAAHSIHIRKQIEECQSRVDRIRDQVARIQVENEKNLDQVIKVIEVITKI